MKTDFEVGDTVVTTKGMYGTAIAIFNDATDIKVGKKIVRIHNSQVRSAEKLREVICYCTDGINDFNVRVPILKQVSLFEYKNPNTSKLVTYCDKFISKRYPRSIIKKIELC